MKVEYSIILKTKNWPRRLKKVNQIINKVFKNKKMLNFDKKSDYFFNFILTNDYFTKKMNKTYKNKNFPTDVLTFIYKIKKRYNFEKHCDIMISAETIIYDSKKLNINFYDNFLHLIIHSILHVNGYDHNNNKNYLIMRNKEIKILKYFGIKNPYK
ncbi:MAG: Endoribonuclease YbeY [Alphaproteobacteria bacterium MarineAlpha5_Bin9]|nr:MAG: Endoribonuclease YbeY [Alphaproteobacteria bacterium MarineAlpha5_Bin9]|tara:strand:+ start:4551 stop:5018 length:468 start_codon:yes stop_codon:yes gene_type:complete